MAKILITGGAGFIAFHLAQKLAHEGHFVAGFDNFNRFYDPMLKRRRAQILEGFGLRNGIHVHNGDLTNEHALEEALGTIKYDLVMHLGAYAGVRHSLDFPKFYIQDNVQGTQNLIDAMIANDIPNVVYASTSCTMAGNPLPWKEDLPQHHHLNPYGASKRMNESQFNMSKLNNVIGLRFFTVYGPWGRPDMALFTFTRKLLAGEPITVYNYGDMKRDFTYVDDIVQGIMIVINRALTSTNTTADGKGLREIYNIGNGRQVPLMDFIHEIEKNLGVKGTYDMQPKHPADTQETWSDTTKLQALGYLPKTPIEEGIANFVRWYKSYYNV